MPRTMDREPPTRPPPAPLIVGEHVRCTVKVGSREPPVDAVVISVNDTYSAAAREYTERQEQLPNRAVTDGASYPDQHPTLHDLTDDPGNDPSDEHALSSSYAAASGELECDTVDLTCLDTVPLDVDVSRSKITVRGSNAAASHVPDYAVSPQAPQYHTPNSATRPAISSKKRRTLEVSTPAAIEAYAENGHVKPSAMPAPHPITVGQVYVHFSGRDRRLDRWAWASELERASASSVAAAASGLVENTLVDNAVQAEFAGADTPKQVRKLTRSRRREFEEANPISEREVGDEALARMERAREESTKVRNISSIVFGDFHIDAWYFSPFPGRYSNVSTLYMCKFCLKYVRTRDRYTKHCSTCTWRRPPGSLIYEDESVEGAVRVYEIDGSVNTLYCQRLCLLGKLFLDHKTLFFDVAPFLFYVVTLNDELAGFFSKENPIIGSEFNLACILTLPQHQRKGVGNFLIALSYELSKLEKTIGSPERPLSDLGQVSYRSYWSYAIVKYLRSKEDASGVTAEDVSKGTAIRLTDVIATLKSINLYRLWKGETYAKTAAKDLEAAYARISAPRLPLKRRQLLKRYSVHYSVVIPTGKRSRRKRQRAQPEAEAVPDSRQKRSRSGKGGGVPPKGTTGGSASNAKATKSERRASKQKSTFQRGLRKDQLRSMARFVQEHTADAVNQGLPTETLGALAEELGLTLEKCRSKVEDLASSLVAQKREFSGTGPSWEPQNAPDSSRAVLHEKSNPITSGLKKRERASDSKYRNNGKTDDEDRLADPSAPRSPGRTISLARIGVTSAAGAPCNASEALHNGLEDDSDCVIVG